MKILVFFTFIMSSVPAMAQTDSPQITYTCTKIGEVTSTATLLVTSTEAIDDYYSIFASAYTFTDTSGSGCIAKTKLKCEVNDEVQACSGYKELSPRPEAPTACPQNMQSVKMIVSRPIYVLGNEGSIAVGGQQYNCNKKEMKK